MTDPKIFIKADGRDLILTFVLNAPPERVFRAWTDPALITQWFTLADWKATSATLDVRAGGSSIITMHKPDGTKMLNQDVYLEVIEDRKLVFTDAYTSSWEPSDGPFLTWVLAFGEESGATNFAATARHWSVADREAHEEMGFHQNWLTIAERLAALVEQA